MRKLQATLLAVREWIGVDLVREIDRFRRESGEVQRDRCLGTANMLWLMLAVALDNHRRNLVEIMAMAYHDLGIKAVSDSAFCQSRMRFSPRGNAPPARVDNHHCRIPWRR